MRLESLSKRDQKQNLSCQNEFYWGENKPPFESATFSFRVQLQSTRIRWIWHTNPLHFESALQSRNFWIRYESGIVRTLNSDIFLSGDVTRSSSVLYREYLDACSVANIPRGVLGARVNPDTCPIRVDGQIRFELRIRVDVEIFESGKKKLRLQKYPQTSGRDLNALNLDLKQRPGEIIRQGSS